MDRTAAVVGCGRWGTVHLRTLLAMREAGSISRVVACDVLAEQATQSSETDASYLTMDEMCAKEALDLIVIATPNDTHYELGMTALSHGIHTLIEKPFAPSVEEAQALIAAAQANGVAVSCGHLLRHHPGVVRIREILFGGGIGRPVMATYRRTTLRPKPSGVDIVDGLASHGVDAMNFLMPNLFAFSDCRARNVSGNEDSVRFEIPSVGSNADGSTTAHIEVAWGAEKEQRDLIITGTDGKVVLDFGQHESFVTNDQVHVLSDQTPPLEAQLRNAIYGQGMAANMVEPLLSTVLNVAMVKQSMAALN
jgi:UDP-N-acetylglucosamine 3-dehydrogenase